MSDKELIETLKSYNKEAYAFRNKTGNYSERADSILNKAQNRKPRRKESKSIKQKIFLHGFKPQ